MNSIIDYFSNVPDIHRIVLLGASMFLLWNIENFIGLKANYKKWKHAFKNALFTLVDAPVQAVMGILFVAATTWVSSHQFGFLHLLGATNNWLIFASTFIFLDFGEYIYHIFMHKIKRLWMFHLVHHTDSVVDVSSTLREHPVESAIRLSFLLLWVFVSGATFWAILFRQFIQIVSNVFAHANFRLSEKADSIVSWVFVTPNFHHVHHHFQQPYTDSNYGDVLSIWDRIFGTYRTLSADKVVFGVDTYMNEAENTNFGTLIKIPFREYRAPSTTINEEDFAFQKETALSCYE